MNDSISSSSLNVRDFTTLGVSVDDQTPKHLEFDFENMSSMTSQSTGQFCRDLAFAEGSRTNGGSVSDQSAFREVHMEPLEIVVHSMPSMGSQDTPFHPSFIDYGMRLPMPQVVQSLQLHYAEPYFGGAIPAVPRSMLLGVGPMRMQLPQDCPYDTPVYVNAKQYHTILRRRQVRSRLMAQNKIPNCRKPYIHESRHLHAVKRPRGSSGRFLNTKKAEEEESKTIPNNTIDQPCQGGTEPEFSQVHHMENVKDAPCTTPSGSSDVTSTSNSGDAFQPPDHEVSNNPSDIGNSTGGMQNQHQLMEVHN